MCVNICFVTYITNYNDIDWIPYLFVIINHTVGITIFGPGGHWHCSFDVSGWLVMDDSDSVSHTSIYITGI